MKSLRQSILLLMLVLATQFLGGCSETNPDSPAANGASVHNAAWTNPENLGEKAFHGAEGETSSCKGCHGGDLLGTDRIPACTKCHFTATGTRVPAGVNWVHGTTPHDALLSYGETCNACHATYRRNDLAPANCHNCHSEPDHPLGEEWLDRTQSTFHGNKAESDLDSCKACHGSDLQGGSAKVSCDKCHFGPSGSKVPVGSDWQHGTTPHQDLGKQIDICNACHTVSRLYRNTPESCHDCHGHDSGAAWLLPANHAQQSIADRNACLNCHEMSSGTPATAPACTTCHVVSEPPSVLGECTSCHANPPSSGAHALHVNLGASCEACHNGFGSGTLGHWYPDPQPPADMAFSFSNSQDFMVANTNEQGGVVTCTGICHVGSAVKGHYLPAW